MSAFSRSQCDLKIKVSDLIFVKNKDYILNLYLIQFETSRAYHLQRAKYMKNVEKDHSGGCLWSSYTD